MTIKKFSNFQTIAQELFNKNLSAVCDKLSTLFKDLKIHCEECEIYLQYIRYKPFIMVTQELHDDRDQDQLQRVFDFLVFGSKNYS